MTANGYYTQDQLVLAEPRLGWPMGYLQPRAARAWFAIKAYFALRGFNITFNEGYRPIATQVYYRNLYLSGKGNPAAIPGTSKHGDGWATDIDYPMTSWSSTEQLLWVSVEAGFGWSSTQGRADGEPWHKVNIAEPSAASVASAGGVTTIEEDEMSAEDSARLKNIEAWLVNGGTDANKGFPGAPGTILRYAHDAVTYAKGAYDMVTTPVHGRDREDGKGPHDNPQIQELADTNTIVRSIKNFLMGGKAGAIQVAAPEIDYKKLADAIAPAVADELQKRLGNG